ncbi:Organic solute transporter alpha-like protein 2 [Aphelenchoides bicaudatus]|nr:Organic solute transporter alpha-like protein 2 [Aphelenchoides bicaudatus]
MVNFVDTVLKLLTDSLTNCSNKDNLPPSAKEHLSHLEAPYVISIIVASLLFLLTTGLFILHLIFIGRYCKDIYRRAFILFLSGTPVFISFFALVALYMPRIWFLSYLLSFFYFSLSIYVTVCLLLQLVDGKDALVKSMHKSDTRITITTPPFCCLFICLPEVPVHVKKIKYVELAVMQTPLIRLVCTVISLILYFESFEKSFTALKILDFISLPSLLLGIYGLHILSNTVCKLEEISHSRYMFVFRLVDLFFMVFGLQTPIFELTARAGGFSCGAGQMNALDVAYFWKNVAIVVESFVVSIIASILLKPSRTGLFDKYNASCRSVASMSTTASTVETVESAT